MKNIDACEKWLDNCVVPATVAQEVKRRSFRTYSRFKDLVTGKKRWYMFSNENVQETFVPDNLQESIVDRDTRAVQKCAAWYTKHLEGNTKVILLNNGDIDESSADVEMVDSSDVVMESPSLRCVRKGDSKVSIPLLEPMDPLDSVKVVQMTIHDYAKTLNDESCMESLANFARNTNMIAKDETNAYYPKHLSEAEMMRGKEDGRYYHGILHLYIGSYQRGYVACNGHEFKVEGLLNLNRAIDGDFVCIELLESAALSEVADISDDVDASVDISEVALDVALLDGAEDAPNSGTQGDKSALKKICRVVGILKRNCRPYCGSLLPLEGDTSASGTIERIFIPVDVRIPFIRIETKKSSELDRMRIVVNFDSWDRFSKRPSGHWVEILGPIDDRDVESAVILKEHQVKTEDFPLEAYKELPEQDWKIPDDERAKRMDYTKACLFSVDPPGCKDIDDALGFKRLKDGSMEFSVHIADVTYFVKPGSHLDQEASERCTTVYLVDRRTDMLPSLLTTDLCSLVPERERLAFSVICRMNESGAILETKFGKSVIRSVRAFTYKEAQDLIDANGNDEISVALKEMNAMAKKLREMRFKRGAIELGSSDVKFEFDAVTVSNVESYKIYDTNKMIEEFMLLANVMVASKIHASFPKSCLLRRHPPPAEERLEDLKRLLEEKGINFFSFGNSKELNESLQKLTKFPKDFLNAAQILTTRCMSQVGHLPSPHSPQAIYINSSDLELEQFKHYGLCTDLYTHFTSPIRRYADVVVHRLLAACLEIESMDWRLDLTVQAEKLNRKHRNAQWCGRESKRMFAHIYFKEQGPQDDEATVLDIMENRVLLLSSKYGTEAIARVKDADFCSKTRTLSIAGKKVGIFDKLKIKIYNGVKHFRNVIEADIVM
ncbi:hypothetical protein BEWA_028900 [Theileria equi strain WA]|uniref:Ribosomal RNA-processing protein 44 n=1 Tax=Theileria equi strain WA TaxID=1537102 RepID=L0AWW1_THEEQ|nr:hypothetical protein BEWA_028900 [Theileria equi strain WA]AFZ80040.1 hypothetical protein BEWA_028900 [Theileria equi strain WA]|eukprot:XP_004829706.1 hypothetical protein BEWA_028900 [Theileria equi strain WA]